MKFYLKYNIQDKSILWDGNFESLNIDPKDVIGFGEHNVRLKSFVETQNLLIKIFEKMNNIEFLDFSYNIMEKLEPELFKNLTKLKKLYLSNNKFKYLNNLDFKYLENLEELDISYNPIENLESDLFKNISKLKKLNLKFINSVAINLNIFKNLVNLEHLNIYYENDEFWNSNIYIPNKNLSNKISLDNLINLKELTINENIIILEDKIFKNLINLEKLSILNNSLKHITKYNFYINQPNKLYLLNINNNIETINSNAFDSLINLEEIIFKNNHIKIIDINTFLKLKKLKRIFIESYYFYKTKIIKRKRIYLLYEKQKDFYETQKDIIHDNICYRCKKNSINKINIREEYFFGNVISYLTCC